MHFGHILAHLFLGTVPNKNLPIFFLKISIMFSNLPFKMNFLCEYFLNEFFLTNNKDLVELPLKNFRILNLMNTDLYRYKNFLKIR